MRIKREDEKSKNADEEGIKALKDKCLIDKGPNYRPPSKPPYILNVNGEVIGIIENMVPKPKPPPKPPPKAYDRVRVSWIK